MGFLAPPIIARQVKNHHIRPNTVLDAIDNFNFDQACRLTYLEEELPLVFLITFLLLLLSVPLPSSSATISTRRPVSSKDKDEKEKNSQNVIFDILGPSSLQSKS